MINIGTRINNYIVTAIANGYALAMNNTAPEPFVVWNIDADGCGVHTGRYFNDSMEAEWEFCGLAFEWFQDNVIINYEEDITVDLDIDAARVTVLEEHLSEAHTALAKAMDLIEELFAEHERLCPKEDRITDEPIEKVAKEFAEDADPTLRASRSGM